MRLIKLLFFGLGFCFATLSANATILFAGGEDTDLTFIGGAAASTAAGSFRVGYARGSIIMNTTANNDPPAQSAVTPTVANQTTLWIHAEVYTSSSIGNNQEGLGVYGSDGIRRLIIRQNGAAGTVRISTRNTAGTITDLVTCTGGAWPLAGALAKMDFYVNYAVSGEVALYINGVRICDYTGNVTTNSVTAVNQVDFDTPSYGQSYWSEIILSTTDTRSMNLVTCAPQANGHTMAWTGSYTNVNPTAINDASSITTGSNAQIAEFTCPSLPSGSFTVPAVTQSARVQIGSSGPTSFYFIARPGSGSTDYNNGSTTTGTTNFANYYNIWPTNPATSSPWTTTDLGSGTNFGIESEP